MSENNGIGGMPVSERPRERAYVYGMRQLSNAELLAILISTGTKGMDAIHVAQQLLKHFSTEGCDSLNSLASRSIAELQDVKGLGRAKATRVLAAMELGRRLLASDGQPAPVFNSIKAVFDYYRPRIGHLNHEEFTVALLNSGNRLIRSVLISTGILNATIVHPREVFREAIVENAASVILIHNHPSGNPEPSPEDLRMTAELIAAGKLLSIPVIDHVVIAASSFKSIVADVTGNAAVGGIGQKFGNP